MHADNLTHMGTEKSEILTQNNIVSIMTFIKPTTFEKHGMS